MYTNYHRNPEEDPEDPEDLEEQEEQDFLDFINEVRDDFDHYKNNYLNRVQSLVPEIKVVNIRLTGSYAPGRMPTPDSDVDLEIIYYPLENTTPEDVAEALYSNIEGPGGVFDIVPFEIEELEEEAPYHEVQSDLFRESGVNATDIHQVRLVSQEMYDYGWDNFNPVRGIIQQVTADDIEDYMEAIDGGIEHELAWSRELRPQDIGTYYVSLYDGHHRAWAAKNCGLPIRVKTMP